MTDPLGVVAAAVYGGVTESLKQQAVVLNQIFQEQTGGGAGILAGVAMHSGKEILVAVILPSKVFASSQKTFGVILAIGSTSKGTQQTNGAVTSGSGGSNICRGAEGSGAAALGTLGGEMVQGSPEAAVANPVVGVFTFVVGLGFIGVGIIAGAGSSGHGPWKC